MSTRFFYVVHFADPDIQRCLDAIRFLCNPTVKWRAHITVRGPYRQKCNLEAAAKKIAGCVISIDNAGCFFEERQNTVFLKCASDRLREIWQKTDFAYNPHITLYDGDSRDFATALVERLNAMGLQFSCMIDDLRPLVSLKGQLELCRLFDSGFVSTLIGESIDVKTVAELTPQERLSFIEKLLRKLPRFGATEDDLPPQLNHIPHKQNSFPVTSGAHTARRSANRRVPRKASFAGFSRYPAGLVYWGKGYKSTAYDTDDHAPSPKPPSR